LAGDFKREDRWKVVLGGGSIDGVTRESYGVVGVQLGIREGSDPKALIVAGTDPRALVAFVDEAAQMDPGPLRGAGEVSHRHEYRRIGRETLEFDGQLFL